MRSLMERLVAALLLVVLSPGLAVIGGIIRIESRGPALFRQERVGRSGQTFKIVKFRTMISESTGNQLAVTSADDRRITRVGKYLRSSKLDEIPQFINIVKGEMAFVGPRPEVSKYAQMWSSSQREQILSILPGVTDPASVRFRREAEILAGQADPEAYYVQHILPKKAEIYVCYAQSKSFRGDLRIVLATIRSVVTQ